MSRILYREVKNDCEDFSKLSQDMDMYLDMAIGGKEKRVKYKEFNKLETMNYIVVAYHEDSEDTSVESSIPIGCGALREYSGTQIEVKRVFVKEGYRNQGVATEIMRMLQDYSIVNGYREIILETGEFLKESVRLYTNYGFVRIENYGVYINFAESLCMSKKLTLPDQREHYNYGLRYSLNRDFSAEILKDLYKSVGWLSANYADRLVNALRNAGTVISVWDRSTLVGLIEVIDDGELTGYIHYLIIREEYQRRGIGKKLLKLVKERYKNYLYLVVISGEERNVGFYEKCGFLKPAGAVPMQILTL